MGIWKRSIAQRMGIVVIVMFLVSACAGLVPAVRGAPGGGEPAPRVFFVEPADGASVSSPVQVVMSGAYFTVEPAGEIRPGAGHLHIMVDAECVAAGSVVPKDETHLHYGGGQLGAELELAPGAHTLCLQAADGAHIALPGEGMTDEITITVR